MAYFLTIVSATFFALALGQVQAIRIENHWLYLLLPTLLLPILWDRKNASERLSTRDEVAALKIDGRVQNAVENVGVNRPTSWRAGLILLAFTLLAHLTGASVGREAVGVQLGGWAARLRNSRNLSFCIAAGFAVVLGTPLAAAVFVFESKRWRLSWQAWQELFALPVLAWIALRVSILLGVAHSEYWTFQAVYAELLSISFFSLVIVAMLLIVTSILFGVLFLLLSDRVQQSTIAAKGQWGRWLAPFLFFVVMGAVFFYLGPMAERSGLPGLGIDLVPALSQIDAPTLDFWNHPLLQGFLKVILTAVFVGFGVRGGELTPLLVAGACAAVGLGALLEIPAAGLVPIGFTVVWGVSSRRPLTAALIAVEIFGFSPWAVLGALVFTLVFVGIKLGDFVTSFHPRLAPLWRRGLYG